MTICLFLSRNLFFFLIFVVASLILFHVEKGVIRQNPQNQEKPEEIHGLQASEQSKCDDLTDPALVLLGFPVQFVWPNSSELGQAGPKDFQVDEMSKVNPDMNEQDIERHDHDRVEVVQSF